MDQRTVKQGSTLHGLQKKAALFYTLDMSAIGDGPRLDVRCGWAHFDWTHVSLGRTLDLDTRHDWTRTSLGRALGLDTRLVWTPAAHGHAPRPRWTAAPRR
ncbi:hypothetical protein COLSTE_02291 [Collinsella stercoris DSM 13279]|uniref:Uncharacterized protein n=1 Tax=Collinsella stercoris DSM 13279 TaxID=445975 RepID=B6GDX4_9ACTN|nr:hypothetical protein COLSTE_02291 [Collinsella stercoris DSM 13279]